VVFPLFMYHRFSPLLPLPLTPLQPLRPVQALIRQTHDLVCPPPCLPLSENGLILQVRLHLFTVNWKSHHSSALLPTLRVNLVFAAAVQPVRFAL